MCDVFESCPETQPHKHLAEKVIQYMPATNPDHDRIDHNLTNHAPVNDDVIDAFERVRDYAKLLGHTIVDKCPESREKSLALTNLEQTVMWAVAAIARNQPTIE